MHESILVPLDASPFAELETIIVPVDGSRLGEQV